ncbi:uncharacterized protein LOC141697138 [Apium graveolens]|uniref:uncharacterized protein LOC141697138 n=1 Tax=Apium graveolens TaxID=4045 RepID=UPI003D79864A
MDDKQLNFFRPLLSVRRVPSTLSSEKSEKRKTDLSKPKIPPLPSYKSELKSGPIRNAGTVPFVWERSPGRPKDENIPQKLAVERPLIAPKLPPGRILRTTKEDSDKNPEHPSLSKRHGEVPTGSLSVSVLNELESSEDTMEAESSVSGDGDEAYVDALDTLSRAESSFINCSVSGVSEVDVLNVNTSETFSTDPQTRDFMMGRFLPAARAMVSETPKYVPKKKPPAREQPRTELRVTSVENRSPLRYGFNDISHYALKKDEESDDDYDGHEQFPAKICGVLPRFLLKSSLCLLNPVPGTGVRSMRTRVPMSPGSRTHASSSSTGSSCETENEVQSDPLSCPFNPKKLEGSSLYRRLQGRGLPSTHNELPQPAFTETKEFRSTLMQAKYAEVTGYHLIREDVGTFEKLSSDRRIQGQPETGSPVIEKTLHVDIVHKVESPDLYSYDFITTGEGAWNDLLKWKNMETVSVNASDKATKNQNVEDEEANLKTSYKVSDLSVQSVADKSNKVLAFEQNKELSDDLSNSAEAATQNLGKTFAASDPPKAEDIKKSSGSQEFPVPPPLPKSPSDSWLWRTLPSKSSRTPALQSNLGTPQNQASKAQAMLRT